MTKIKSRNIQACGFKNATVKLGLSALVATCLPLAVTSAVQAQSCSTIGTLSASGARDAMTSDFSVSDGDTVTVAVFGTGGAEVEVSFLGSSNTGIVDFTTSFVVSGVGTTTSSVYAGILTGPTGVDIDVTCSVGTAPPPPPPPTTTSPNNDDPFRRAAALRFASDSVAEFAPGGGVPFSIGVGRRGFSFAGSLSQLRGVASKSDYLPGRIEPFVPARPSRRVGPAIAGDTPISAGDWDIWTRGALSYSTGANSSDASQGYVMLGATYFQDTSRLFGATLLLGTGQTDSGNTYDNDYLGLTLYTSGQSASGLTFTPYLSYLRTDTDVTQGSATGSYLAETWTAGARLSARRTTQVSNSVQRYFEPNAEFAYGWDSRPSYTLSNSTVIAAASDDFGVVKLGPTWGKITHNPSDRVARLEQRFGITLDWDYLDFGPERAGVGLGAAAGLAMDFKNGGALSLTANARGLGRDNQEYTIGFQYTRATR